jgi:O-antigen/teichoic acid export membrane protein
MSLKKQTLTGLFWSFGNTIVIKGLFFIATIILARLLGPSEFGLMGMIAVFISIGASLVDSGMASSLIRTQNANDEDFSTVFYLNIAFSFVLYLVFFFLAPLIAAFYNQFVLIDLIRLYCLSFIITSFSSIQLTLLNKEMKFRKIMLYNMPGNIIGIIVGIVLGIKGYGVYSIVWMYLTTQLSLSIFLWAFSKWKPKKIFSVEKMKYHLSFGYKLTLSSLLDIIFKNSYNVLIGKFFPIKTLGYFERAQALNEYPVAVLTGVMSSVSYPMLSKLQDQKEKITEVYKKLLKVSFFVIAPMMLGVAIIANPLFLLILGQEWIKAVPYFQILCLGSMFYPIHVFNINVLKVFGRSDLFLKIEIIKKIVITISLIIAFQFGIMGLVWSTVFVSIVALFINTYYTKGLIYYTAKDQIFDMIPTLFHSVLMALFMFYILNFLKNEGLYIQVSLTAIGGLICYFLLHYLFKTSVILIIIDLTNDLKNKFI